MITKNWPLTVDFEKGVSYRPMRFVAGDYGPCSITFTTIQDIEAGLRVFVTFVMSDGTNYIEEATVTDANTAVLVLPSGALSVVGRVNCQVAVHGDRGRLTNAVGFYYTVESDLAEGVIEASDQYPILTQLIAECEGIEDAEALRVIAEGAADPRSGRVGAELDREDAEAIRIANEGDETSGRVKAELDRAAAELLRAAAEGAASPRSGRVGAELDRVDAELARVAAEGDATKGRVKAENDRVAAEEAREIAEGLRQAHVTAKNNPHEVTAAQAGAVPTTAITNTLTETAEGKVLDARQGKALADLVSTNLNATIKNEIKNGDFSGVFVNDPPSIEGWGLWGNSQISNHIWVIEDEKFKTHTSGDTSASGRIYQDIPCSINDKYYLTVTFEGSGYTRVNIYDYKTDNNLTVLTTDTSSVGKRSYTFTSDRSGFRFNVAHLVSPYTYTNRTLDNIMLINLTQTFGAGNEPTKEEMDVLILLVPNGYWEGELTLSQKLILNWQLALIRANTLAIASL